MTKIKIIRNPYQKLIEYQIYDEFEREWINIVDQAGYNGKLKAGKMIHGFFPFIVNDVVDIIIDEYDDAKDQIQLFFDGTTDEYADLEAVCESDDIRNMIDLQPIGRVLNNAYEILPRVIHIFDQNISPIIEKSISDKSPNKPVVEKDLKKYSDASNDVIPICVIGNYSAGKSSFINALIGSEILPSGDKAVTARIYKIYRVKNGQNASVTFSFNEENITLNISEDSFSFSVNVENGAVVQLRERLSAITEPGCVIRLNKALDVLNGFTNGDGAVGPMIEIYIPFTKGLWDEFPGNFAILDTPGSNAASHADHKAVLTDAMEGMSNGIPVYIAELDTLDSTDNESLYDLVRQMDGLDPRFTMIIANKADTSNIPRDGFSEQDIDSILHEAIPKNLYSSGIYFVSSIMGLGAKNGGHFIDDHCDEIFEMNESKFSDKTNRHYKELYRYDIMPKQIKAGAMSDAQNEAAEQPLFVNSGLYSVEHAIQTFAEKYASYNKCQQSKLFLEKVIGLTKTELVDAIAERESSKKEMEEKLEHDKQEMIRDIEASAKNELTTYQESYDSYMEETIDQAKQFPQMKELKEMESQFTQEQQQNLGVESLKENAQQQRTEIGDALRENFQKIEKEFSWSAVKGLGSAVFKETKEALDSNSKARSASREADRAAAGDLIQEINVRFCTQAKTSEKWIDESSKNYWMSCSMTFRDKLAEIVKNTSLSEQKSMN